MHIGVLSYIALFCGLAALIIAAALVVFVLRWRMAFVVNDGDKKLALVPDSVLNKNEAALKGVAKKLQDHQEHQEALSRQVIARNKEMTDTAVQSNIELAEAQKKVWQALQSSLAALADLREETKILRSEIQTQARELERHRNGYDTDILKASLIPVARMHRVIRQDLGIPDLHKDVRTTLEALEDQHLEVLETRGVKLVTPPKGEKYRDQKNIKHPPQTEPTSDASLVGTIKEVLSPAYELETAARNVVLLEATVIVYSAPESSNVEDTETTYQD